MIKFIKIDEQTRVGLIAVALCQFFLPNAVYLFACFAVFIILFFYVQQMYKPGVFSVILVQHFLQVVAGVWLANNLGKEINFRSQNVTTATIASLVGIVVLFLPIVNVQKKIPVFSLAQFRAFSYEFSTRKIFNCYLIAFIVTTSLSAVAFAIPGITQVIISVIKIKWLFFLLFGYQSVLKKEMRLFFYAAIGFEFISGFFSFFSDFKTVIYFLVVLFLPLVNSINFKQLFYTIVLGVVLGVFGLFWTSIKSDYRAFLNGGTKSQAVTVSNNDALEKLQELSREVEGSKITSATEELLDRLQYTYHFGKAIDRVPSIIPFQNGNNWLQNIEFSTTPRFLNPNKPNLDNSVKATKYTGIKYAGAAQGVSFSLGYFAEFYIDFGLYGMMAGIYALGLLYAAIYKYIITKSSKNLMFNYCVTGAFFLEFMNFEMDGTFLTGRLFASFVTFFILIQFGFPRVIEYISLKQSTPSISNP